MNRKQKLHRVGTMDWDADREVGGSVGDSTGILQIVQARYAHMSRTFYPVPLDDPRFSYAHERLARLDAWMDWSITVSDDYHLNFVRRPRKDKESRYFHAAWFSEWSSADGCHIKNFEGGWERLLDIEAAVQAVANGRNLGPWHIAMFGNIALCYYKSDRHIGQLLERIEDKGGIVKPIPREYLDMVVEPL